MKMKHILSALFLALLAVAAPAQNAIVAKQFAVVNTSTTVPLALTNATDLRATSFTIIGKAGAQGAANAGSVYLGTSAVDGANCYEITSGSYHVFTAERGQSFRLSDFYIDVTSANDGVCILWQ